MSEATERRIGSIGNYYGGLYVKADETGCWWGIADYDESIEWELIPDRLYRALVSFGATAETRALLDARASRQGERDDG